MGEVTLVLDQQGNRPGYFIGTLDGESLLSGGLGGSTSVKPFIAKINDSLKVDLLAAPAANLDMSTGFKALNVSNGFVILYALLDNYSYDDLGPARLSKISNSGQIEWEKTYLTNAQAGAKSITRDQNDMIYLLAGNYYTDTAYCSLLKIGNDGIVLWEKTMAGFTAGDVITSVDNNIFYHTDSVSGKYFPVITKVDINGTKIWSKTLQPNNGSDWKTILSPSKDGGCIVVYQPGRDSSDHFYYHSTRILKLTSNGIVAWQTKIEPKSMIGDGVDPLGGFSRFGGIFVDHNSNNYIVGSVFITSKLAIVKFDKNGIWIKSKIFINPADMERVGIGMTENSKGEFIVCSRDYRWSSTLPYLFNTILFKMNEDFEML